MPESIALPAYEKAFLRGVVKFDPAHVYSDRLTGLQKMTKDKVVLKIEGGQINLTASAIDAVAALVTSENPRVVAWLTHLRQVETDEQEF